MISKKNWITLLAVSALAFGVYGCSDDDDDTKAPEKAAIGADCTANSDCASDFCDSGKCAVKGEEPVPEKGEIGADCTANVDCASDFCDGGKCAAKGEEPAPEKGEIGADCKANADCVSDFCDGGKCAAKASGELDPVTFEELTAVEKTLTSADVVKVSADDMKLFGDNLNAFSQEFEKELGVKKSYVFSAFSYHSALSMTAYGAMGDTYNEMAKAIHLDSDKEKAAKLNGDMRINLRFDGQDEKSKFEIANRIWIDKSAEIVPAFNEGMDKYYKAPLKVVDFKNDYAKYVNVINTWVSNNTGNMIENLLSPNALSADTRMVLVNAIHFDGEWEQKFEYKNSYDGEFNVSKTKKEDARMMNLDTHQFVYYKSEENKYQTASMDYKGGKFAMLIVLPDEIDGLAAVAAKLDGAEIRKILDGQDLHNGNIEIPKFKIETEINAADNKTIFTKLGMEKAFVAGVADFTGMIVPNEDNPAIHIGSIIHKAIIEVDEEGTKAAAATAVIVDAGAAMPPEDFVHFTADHPFEFVLYHKASGTILFSGQYLGK